MTSTFKQRFIEMTGKEVPLDLFLYSCFEAEKMLAEAEKRVGGPENLNSRNMDTSSATGLGAGDEAAWENVVARLYSWHSEREPALVDDSKPVDIELLCPVSDAFAAFHADLRNFYQSATGESLPVFDMESGLAPVWVAVMNVLRNKSPRGASLFEKYFAWTYSDWEAPVYEVGSRPPVGRYAPPPRLRAGGPGGKAGPDRPDRPDRSERHDRPDRGERHARPDRPDRPERGHRTDRPRRDDRHQRDENFGNRAGHEERSVEQERAALAEVDKAVDLLNSNANLAFVDLPPTNSFQRRKQHHAVMEHGFKSSSVGEGKDRAVRVSRDGKA